ncbi:DUF1015 domain-containing protein [Actinopolymorpha sp. B11F2]|uniref:DUF1015 domain-containing protein n=1 Tax=Actinopolymorpha sp. B11F2 TaxID=3160862 RepID=UPI0032E3CA0E
MTDAAPGRRPLVLKAFRGLRYSPALVSDLASVTSPPYDTLDDDAIAALEAAEPYNIVRIILPRPSKHPAHSGAPTDVGAAQRPAATPRNQAFPDVRADEGRYDHARDLFIQWRREGVVVPDDTPALYVYEQDLDLTVPLQEPSAHVQEATSRRRSPSDRTQRRVVLRGLLGAVALRAYDEQVILPHEDVLPGPVGDRLALMRVCAANFEPILLAYDGDGQASALVDAATTAEPLVDALAPDGTGHRIWRLDDPAHLAAIAADLAPRQALIADGHHRYAAYLRLQAERHAGGAGEGPWDNGLALLVDHRTHPLELRAIHRLVTGLTMQEVADRVAPQVEVLAYGGDSSAAREALAGCRAAAHGFLLTDGSAWMLLRVPLRSEPTSATPPALDTEILHELILGHLLRIPEDRIRYVHDAGSAIQAARADEDTVAVLLNPVDLTRVQQVARHGGRMPRKSTSFGPKPRTGFVMRSFDEG